MSEKRINKIADVCTFTFILAIVLLVKLSILAETKSDEARVDKLQEEVENLKIQNQELLDSQEEYIYLVKTNYERTYETELMYAEASPKVPYKVYEVDNPQYHKKKIYTEFTEVTLKSSLQYKLLYSDWDGDGVIDRYSDYQSGVRVIRDQYGVERFCVAVGTFWAEGHIGRYIDFVTENGEVIPCVTCDVKQDVHTKGFKGKYGSAANDLIEFYVDPMVLPFVDYDNVSGAGLRFPAGDVSTARNDFKGAIVKVIVYDAYMEGFEFQKK